MSKNYYKYIFFFIYSAELTHLHKFSFFIKSYSNLPFNILFSFISFDYVIDTYRRFDFVLFIQDLFAYRDLKSPRVIH